MGILVPEQYNGSGFGYFEYVTAIQELAIVDPSIALSVAAHNSLCTGHILNHGNEAQKINGSLNLLQVNLLVHGG